MSSNRLTVMEKIKQDLMPAGVSGLTSVAIYSGVLGESFMQPTDIFGMNVPTGLLVGGTVFLSHLIGNILEYQVLDMWKSSKEDKIAYFVKPAISGLSTFGLFYLLNGSGTDFMYSFGIGGASTFAGGAIYDKFLKKM